MFYDFKMVIILSFAGWYMVPNRSCVAKFIILTT